MIFGNGVGRGLRRMVGMGEGLRDEERDMMGIWK